MTVLERIGQTLRTALAPLPPLQARPRTLRDPALTAFYSSTAWADTPAPVNETTALHFPAVWAAVQTIAGDVASLPFIHYRRTADGAKDRYTTSRLYRVLHDEFNPEMTAFVGRETMMAHVLLWGNAYAEITRNDLGQVTGLWPIEPNRVMPERAPSGAIVYRVQAGDGRDVLMPMERMLHVVGLGYTGLMGYSVIGMMRESLAVGIAAETLGSQVMSRGAKYSGFFEHPRTLGATAHKNLKESMASDLPGTYRILEEGMVYKAGSMPLKDAEFMEIRKFSVTEVARIFSIPPHKIGDLERATFSNVEEENISYVNMTLRRWLKRWESECNRKLIAPLEKGLQFTEHLIDDIVRGNIQARYSAFSQGINGGFVKINEARRAENLNPVPGGDDLLVQGAMVPLKRLGDLIDARIERASQTDTLSPVPGGATEPTPDTTPETDEDDRMQRVLGKIFTDLRAEFVESVPAAVVAALPPAPEPAPVPEPPPLRDLWREAAFSVIAGTLVRRERAQLRKHKVQEFYLDRFVPEAMDELRPWLLRLPEPEQREQAAQHVLTVWADTAWQTYATTPPEDLEGLPARWGDARQAALAQALMEAIDG